MMSKYSLLFITDSFRAYVEKLLAFYLYYGGKEPFSDTWESKFLLSASRNTEESLLFLPDDRYLLEQQVVEALESLSCIPLSCLPLDLFVDWGRNHASASAQVRIKSPSQNHAAIEHLQIKSGVIQKTGEGLFKFSNEKLAYRSYVDHVVNQVLLSFHEYLEFEVLGQKFKDKTSGCFGTVDDCLLYHVEKEVYLQLVKGYGDEYRRFSELNLNKLTSAQQYFLVCKAINTETVDMSIVNDDPDLEEWQKTPFLAVIRTQRQLIERVHKKSIHQDIVGFFELVMTDTTVSDDPNSFSYCRTDSCIFEILDRTQDIFHQYLSDICLEVVTNDSIGSALSKKIAMAQLVEEQDTRIVPFVKQWAEDESSPLHKIAEVELFGAIRTMPEYFNDPLYDDHKAVIEESNRRTIRIL
jgi:hypothetical protein